MAGRPLSKRARVHGHAPHGRGVRAVDVHLAMVMGHGQAVSALPCVFCTKDHEWSVQGVRFGFG